MNHCGECGLDFYYAAELHECAHKGVPVAVPESWVDECMRKQREGIQ